MKTNSGFRFIIILTFCALISIYGVKAQEKITLTQAVNKALTVHPSIKSSEMAYESAQWNLKAEKADLLPLVSGGASLQNNLVIPSTPVPLGALQGQGDPNQLTYIKFGTNWQSIIGLSLRYDLLNPEKKQQIKGQEEKMLLAGLDLEGNRIKTKIAVYKAYADVVLSAEQLKYAAEDTLLNYRESAQAERLFHDGKINQAALNNSRLQFSQSLSRYNAAQGVYNQSRIELSYQVGDDPSGKLPTAADSLESLTKMLDTLDLNNPSVLASIEYRKLMTRSSEDSIKSRMLQRMMLPTIAFTANYGSDFYRNELTPFDGRYWYGNSNIGITLNLPITKDINYQRKLLAARASDKQNLYDLEDLENRKKSELEKVIQNMDTYRTDMSQRKSEIALSQDNLNIEDSLLTAGKVLPVDAENARLIYAKARVDYLQAAYNYILAKINIMELTED